MPAFPGTLFHPGEGATDGGTPVSVPSQTSPRSGLLVVAPRGRILFIGHQVTRLLKQYFPPRPHSRLLPKPLARWIASRDPNPLCWERDGGPELSSFTPREISILYWLVMGKTNVEIGIILDLAENTIKKHLTTIFEKLGVEHRLAAALYAREFFPEE
jgi:DNA-binding CsgD family transcriptional regulator